MVTLSKIRVSGLFGSFNHTLIFPEDERVAIMTAPNGFGKTMILRILNILFNRAALGLRTMPFHEFMVAFDDESKMTVTRTAPAATEAKKRAPEIRVHFKKGSFQDTFTPSDLSAAEVTLHPALIDEWLPRLDRIGQRTWLDPETGQRLGLHDVIETYAHQLPSEVQSELGAPKWFIELLQRVSVRFVDIERLTRPVPDRTLRGHGRHSRATERTVRVYSRELRVKIRQKLAEYGSLSQSLDRTFPARLVTEPLRRALTVEELSDKLAEVDAKRRKLVDAGLLEQEYDQFSATTPEIEKLDEGKREVLAMFARDTKAKLGVFDEILEKVHTLTRIANSRFLYKRVSVGQRGILVTTPDGQPLDLTMLSSGEQHQLVLLYDLLFGVSQDTLLMIDEPELSLHVAWQEKFLGDIDEIARLSDFQVLLATHSPQIIGDRYDLAIELGGPAGEFEPATGCGR